MTRAQKRALARLLYHRAITASEFYSEEIETSSESDQYLLGSLSTEEAVSQIHKWLNPIADIAFGKE